MVGMEVGEVGGGEWRRGEEEEMKKEEGEIFCG